MHQCNSFSVYCWTTPTTFDGARGYSVQWNIPPGRTQQSRRIVPHPQHKQLSLVGKLLCARHYSTLLWVGTVGPILQDGVGETHRGQVIQGHLAELSYGPKQSDLRLGFPDPWTDVCRRFWDCTKKKVICWQWRTSLFFLSWACVVCRRPGRSVPWEMKSVGRMALQAGEATAHTWQHKAVWSLQGSAGRFTANWRQVANTSWGLGSTW